MKEKKTNLIVVVINAGFVDLVMDAAKAAGAGGGTVLHGRGTGNKEIEKTFGISITPNKEVVLIIVPNEIQEKVVKAIYREAGLDTKGQGIIFTLPLDRIAGVNFYNGDEKEAKEEAVNNIDE
ncbi:MAG: P-II family nitrogen regulator [Bacilli bacterium]|jgi:nitrogen regulatory protein P-II 1